jgi:glycoside/pentoside/hexuronide:cation symporter, GPH family
MAGNLGPGHRGVTQQAFTSRPITGGDVLSYAMGSFGTGVFSTVPAVLLLYFCTETLGIAGSVAAGLILLPKLWSIVWDPCVGRWSDNSTSRFGRRRPFMVLGIVGMVIAFVLLFNVPTLSPLLTIAWVGVSYFALATLYSLFAVPYIAIPAEVSDTQSTLARLVSWRMVLVMVGILVGAAGAPMVIEAGGSGRSGYSVMGWAIGAMCLVIMAIPLVMLQGRDTPADALTGNTNKVSLIADVMAVMANKRFAKLATAYLAQAIAFGAVSAALPYVVTKGLGKGDGDIGTALGVYLIATLAAVPFWSWAGKRFGLSRALNWSSISYGVGVVAIGAIVIVKADWAIALWVLAVAGIPFAGLQVLPFTLVGEVVRAEGAQAEGKFTGVWTAVEKLGLSIGPALVGLALSLSGQNVPLGLGLFLCVIPPILCLASLFFVSIHNDIKKEAEHG